MGVELLAQVVAHKFHHLVLDGVALGVLRHQFHVRAVLAELLVVLGVGRAAALGVAGEQAVDHGVGIAADGTGEVGVVVERQTEVAYVLGSVFGLHHGSQRHLLYQVLLGMSLTLFHEPVDALCHGFLGAVGLYFVSELGYKLTQRLHLLWVGVVVYAVRQRFGLPAFRGLAHALSHSPVGEQHEFLYQLVGVL